MREIAVRFKVSLSFVLELWQLYQNTGDVKSKEYVRGPKAKLAEENLRQLKGLVEEKKDATLNELVESLKDRYGIFVSIHTADRGLRKLGLTRKKDYPC